MKSNSQNQQARIDRAVAGSRILLLMMLLIALLSLPALFAPLGGKLEQGSKGQGKGKETQPQGIDIEFYKEQIAIHLSGNQVTVEGIYYFRNKSSETRKVTMYYPFPIDEHHPYPHEIEVEGLDFTKGESGIYWHIEVTPYSTEFMKVRYKQKCNTNSATYILTTTQFWERPLEEAEFIIIVPQIWDVTISYPPDQWEIKGEMKYYYITRENFMPQKDLIIRWDQPK